MSADAQRWREADTETFLAYGDAFVPGREGQLEAIAAFLPEARRPRQVLDLGCGAGAVSRAVLSRHPAAVVTGLDASPTMLARAREALAPFGDRFRARPFALQDRDWRVGRGTVDAVVSSLAVHHLDGDGKRTLFQDVAAMLAPGGAFLVADLVAPAGERARRLAADAWDDAVRRRSQELHGDGRAFEAFERLRWNHFRFGDPTGADHPDRLLDQLRWLQAAGFVSVDVLWFRAGHAVFGGVAPVRPGLTP